MESRGESSGRGLSTRFTTVVTHNLADTLLQRSAEAVASGGAKRNLWKAVSLPQLPPRRERGERGLLWYNMGYGGAPVATRNITLKGKVHGHIIELDQNPGIPDGQEVTVTVQSPAQPDQKLPPGEGLRRSAGAWADDIEGLDAYLEWNRQQRKRSRQELEP